MSVTRAQIDEAVARLVAEFRPQRVVLFGSRARGGADTESDVDLLVVHEFQGSRLEVGAQMRARLDATLAIDLVLRRPDEVAAGLGMDFLTSVALREGVTLYERAA